MAGSFRVLDDGSVEVQPGRYWVGDPCLAFQGTRDDEWRGLVAARSASQTPLGRVGNSEMVAFPTPDGDGFFECEDFGVYVTSGLIGIVPARDGEDAPDEMVEVDLDEPENCMADEGRIWIGQFGFDARPGHHVEDEPEADEPAGP